MRVRNIMAALAVSIFAVMVVVGVVSVPTTHAADIDLIGTNESSVPGIWSKGHTYQWYQAVDFSSTELTSTSVCNLFKIPAGYVVTGSLIKVVAADTAGSTVTLDIGGTNYDSGQSLGVVGGFPTDSIKYISSESTVRLECGADDLTSGSVNVWVFGTRPITP